jgi:competence protein ComEA
MNSEGDGLISKITPFFLQYKFPLIIGLIGLICLGYGLISSVFPSQSQSKDIVFTPAEEKTSGVNLASNSQQKIVVDINGAVTKPGVYELREDARLQEGLRMAGGLSEEADKAFIAKQFNLAMKLKDGMKIYIPAVGEGIGSAAVAGASTTGSTSITSININTASESELDTLPGVGKVTADKIIAGRPYGTIEELLEKKIVKQSVFEDIKEKITAY